MNQIYEEAQPQGTEAGLAETPKPGATLFFRSVESRSNLGSPTAEPPDAPVVNPHLGELSFRMVYAFHENFLPPLSASFFLSQGGSAPP